MIALRALEMKIKSGSKTLVFDRTTSIGAWKTSPRSFLSTYSANILIKVPGYGLVVGNRRGIHVMLPLDNLMNLKVVREQKVVLISELDRFVVHRFGSQIFDSSICHSSAQIVGLRLQAKKHRDHPLTILNCGPSRFAKIIFR